MTDVSTVIRLWDAFDLGSYGPWEWVLVLLLLLLACWIQCCLCTLAGRIFFSLSDSN